MPALGWLLVYLPLVLRGTELGSIVWELVKPTTARKNETESRERIVVFLLLRIWLLKRKTLHKAMNERRKEVKFLKPHGAEAND